MSGFLRHGTIMDNKKRTGSGATNWVYYSAMEDLFTDDPSMEPVHTWCHQLLVFFSMSFDVSWTLSSTSIRTSATNELTVNQKEYYLNAFS